MILSFKIRDQLQILLFSILNKNLQKVATEIYKVSKGFLPPLIAELFEPRNKHPYDIRYVSQFDTPSVNTVLMALRASLSQDPKFGTFCQMNSWIFKDWKLSKIELKIRSLKVVLVEFVGIISAMLKKMFGSFLSKVLRFHAFFGYCVKFYLTIWDSDLLFMILI